MGMFHHHGNGKGHRHGGPKPSGVDRESLRGMQALKRLADIKDRREREQLERGIDLGLEAAPSVQDRTISTFSRGQQPAFAGINTFLKAPYCENIRDVGNYDVAILGAPFDMGTTYRAGCRFGPQAVRRISALYDSYNADMAVDLVRGAQPLRRGRRLRHPVEPREVLRPDRPCRLVRPRAGRVPGRDRRRPLDRLSRRPRDRPPHRGQGRDHPPRPPHRHAGTRHGRADAHDAVVPRHQHPERPARATSCRWASAAGTGRGRG